MVKLGRYNQILPLFFALTAMSWLSSGLISLLNHVGNHGIISNVATIISAITGIAGFVSGVVAIVLFLIGQKVSTTLY